MSLLVITGPTASGKTRRAVECARAFGGEIISADSRQVYRGMDIGTGKDINEYGTVPHHLIDIHPAGYHYDLYQFLRDFHNAASNITSRGKMPILCGGTGLYVESAIRGTRLPEVPANPELRRQLEGTPLPELQKMLASMATLHNTTDTSSARRAIRAIEIATYMRQHPEQAGQAANSAHSHDAVIVGVDIDRESRRRRISQRLHSRLDEGMIDEVRRLIDEGVAPEDLIYYGLEYKYLTLHILGQLSLDEMVRQLEIAIHQFAKRQMTWFRGMERRGLKINWLPFDMPTDEFVESVRKLL
ncbi:MAG: tRNA (adenosine(37)-N6)-dimethylallyltransferase MiaA [Bacteroides sp.]|nr:tRNA (adenosine(37)-N6)-dimethylallyltransferase MiaA [Bacteroides sp.]MCM1413318.1 tRNA (adenosine(37)-N6)-dimethylallyltransferase MiaA [Bacteroides sp.]MCM1471996.1 tRNA (adenosine(37)-N6)-dimethylallyltransferase MiaA [Bacteroides sp.]